MEFYLDSNYYMALQESMFQNANNYSAIQPLPMRKTQSLYFYDQNQDKPRKIDPVASGLVSETGEIMPVEGYSFVDYNLIKHFMSSSGSDQESEIYPEHERGSETSTMTVTTSATIFPLDYNSNGNILSYPYSFITNPAAPSRVSSVPKPSARASVGRRNTQSKVYGKKQALIEKSRNDLVKHFSELGLYHGDVYLRGEDTIRIYVKTAPALENIKHVLEEIRIMVGITQIVIPISMKNKHQKKGFTVFAKFASTEDIPKVQSIVQNHSDIFRCDVARHIGQDKNSTPAQAVTAAKKNN